MLALGCCRNPHVSQCICEFVLETLLWPRFAYLLEGQPLGFLLNFTFGDSLSRDFLSSRESLSRCRESQTAIPHLITLHGIFFLINWKFVATLPWASLLHCLPNICSLHVSVSHFDNSHSISSAFMMIMFVIVICNQRSSLWLLQCLGHRKPRPYETANLICKCCVCLMAIPPSLSFSNSPVAWDTILKLGPLITLQQMSVQVKEVAHLPP